MCREQYGECTLCRWGVKDSSFCSLESIHCQAKGWTYDTYLYSYMTLTREKDKFSWQVHGEMRRKQRTKTIRDASEEHEANEVGLGGNIPWFLICHQPFSDQSAEGKNRGLLSLHPSHLNRNPPFFCPAKSYSNHTRHLKLTSISRYFYCRRRTFTSFIVRFYYKWICALREQWINSVIMLTCRNEENRAIGGQLIHFITLEKYKQINKWKGENAVHLRVMNKASQTWAQ